MPTVTFRCKRAFATQTINPQPVLPHGAIGQGESAIGGRLRAGRNANDHVVERVRMVAERLVFHLIEPLDLTGIVSSC